MTARDLIPGTYTCDLCGKETETLRGLSIHSTRVHGVKLDLETVEPTDDFAVPDIFDASGSDETPPTAFGVPYEAAPVENKPKGWREKLWGGDGPPGAPKPTTAERRPRKRRASTEGIWVTAWTGIGLALVRSGADIPVGNALQFQAPIVGDVLDEAIAGTFIDTLLQPIAGTGKKFKKVSSVISLPIIVGVMERSPGAAPMLEPMLRQIIRENLVEMSKVMKTQRRADAEYAKALEDLGMEVGDDPIDAVVASIFSGFGEPSTNGTGAHVQAGT